jgi:hypothetical protein
MPALFDVPGDLTIRSFTPTGGVRMSFETQSLTDEEICVIRKASGQYGHILFKGNTFQDEDIPVADCEDKKKTPGNRLRAVLWIDHIQHGGKKEDFEQFYRAEMEAIISQRKARLDQ